MLLTREEMAFDWGGARLDPRQDRDRDTLVWAVQQFLYGEVTGIQIGHWLYQAPDLQAARFLARQAVEEFQHVGNFVQILGLLGARPEPAHPMVRFLATGHMGGSWAEHVTLEMALGEGLVLQAFYALIDTVDHPEVVDILSRAVKQEERHVAFGEAQTRRAIEGRPGLKRRLLGLSLVTLESMTRLGTFMRKQLPQEHPALRQLPLFVEHCVRTSELRLQRLGLLDRPLAELGRGRKLALVLEAYGAKALRALGGGLLRPLQWVGLARPRRLTDTYLKDPALLDGRS